MKKYFLAILVALSATSYAADMVISNHEVGCYLDARDAMKDIKSERLDIISQRTVTTGAEQKTARLMTVRDRKSGMDISLLFIEGQACILYVEPIAKYSLK